ncbi:MAG: DUF3667 domain-containing protein [Thermomonas sp.]
MPKTASVTPPPPAVPEADTVGVCGNCSTPLLGPHCHACGQPVKGLVRHFSSILGDALDTVFDFDTRIVRTLGPLLVKPGYITREYFAGRRVRYVSPVRLFFFLCILVFFVAQLSFDGSDLKINRDNSGIASAATVGEAEAQRDAALADIEEARKTAVNTPGAIGVDFGEEVIRNTAESRIKVLREAEAKGLPPPKPDSDVISLGNAPWDPKTNRIDIGWLPGFANNWLNVQAGRANSNFARLKDDPSAFKDSVLGAIPTTLFVLVPVFALMLKLAYVFKRRLYMEHVVMALHSHAFLCLDLLLVLLVRALAQWLAPGEGALATLFGWIEGLLLAWIPIYLLIMQKRVYAQGWPMTLLKYFVLGACYTILLSLAMLASAAIGLVAM